jgi:hypothetical protein
MLLSLSTPYDLLPVGLSTSLFDTLPLQIRLRNASQGSSILKYATKENTRS